MELPDLVRERVLQLLFQDSNIRVFLPGRNGDPPTPILLPITARVGNRQLRQETVRAGLMVSTLEIHSKRGNEKLQKWLSSLSLTEASGSQRNGFDAVKKLRFPYFSRFPHQSLPDTTPNSDLQLAKKCSNLRELSINFVRQEVYDYRAPMNGTAYEPLNSAERLRREYRLDGILSLKQLEVLRLEGYCGTDPGAGLQELVTWFKAKFEAEKEAKERKFEVKVILPA